MLRVSAVTRLRNADITPKLSARASAACAQIYTTEIRYSMESSHAELCDHYMNIDGTRRGRKFRFHTSIVFAYTNNRFMHCRNYATGVETT